MSALLAGGCAHEQVGWPPTAADVDRINEAARANDWLRVDYVEPIDSRHHVEIDDPVAISSLDGREIRFLTEAGSVRAVPAEMLTGVTVKERAPGALFGGLIGLAWGVLTIGGLYVLASLGPGDPGAPPARPCDAGCTVKPFIPLIAMDAALGAVIGYFVGGRRTFDFRAGDFRPAGR